LAAAAWTKVIPPELFYELFISMDDPDADFHPHFAGIAATAFAHGLIGGNVERSRLCCIEIAWDTSVG
jgi:hypothetical protein